MRILFLSSWFPYPPDNGSKIRIYNLLRVLADHNELALLTFAGIFDQISTEELLPLCRVVGILPMPTYNPSSWRAFLGFASPTPRWLVDTFSTQMAQLVRQELTRGDYQVVIASELNMARYIRDGFPTVRVLDDVETSVFRETNPLRSNLLQHLRRSATWTKTRYYIERLLPNFAACTVVSEQEKANLHDAVPEYDCVEIIPNGVDTGWLRMSEYVPQPNTLIFNGALTYSANYDAMRYFLSEVWHRIRIGEPSAKLKITGRAEGVHLEELRLGDGVSLTGNLPDIRPAVGGTWACVVPLRVGSGTRLKILEAMALGTPVVATSKGAEGLDVTSDENILLADTPAEFAAQTLRLLRDSDLRQHLAENARRLVEEKYSWQIIGQQFNQLVESVAYMGSTRGPN